MIRRTKEEAECTRASLLDAAEQVFAEKGVSQTTLSDIASAAGLTRGAVYWHFKNKVDIFSAMCERATLPMEVLLEDIMGCADANPLAALEQLFTRMLTSLAQSTQQQRVFGIMLHKCENIGEMALPLAQEEANVDQCFVRLTQVLEKAVAQGQLPSDTDVPLALQILHNFLVGTMYEWLEAPSRFDLAQSAPSMVAMVFAGLKACPPRRTSGA